MRRIWFDNKVVPSGLKSVLSLAKRRIKLKNKMELKRVCSIKLLKAFTNVKILT